MPGRLRVQPWLDTQATRTGKLEVRVDADARQILVTTPTGSFRVTYVPNSIQLSVKAQWSDCTLSPSELGRLQVDAWRLATDTAHELGWF